MYTHSSSKLQKTQYIVNDSSAWHGLGVIIQLENMSTTYLTKFPVKILFEIMKLPPEDDVPTLEIAPPLGSGVDKLSSVSQKLSENVLSMISVEAPLVIRRAPPWTFFPLCVMITHLPNIYTNIYIKSINKIQALAYTRIAHETEVTAW